MKHNGHDMPCLCNARSGFSTINGKLTIGKGSLRWTD
jgi:hypothetical protein